LSVRLRNTTGSDIFINSAGELIQAGETQVFDPKSYASLQGGVLVGESAEDPALIAAINNGSLVVNDGDEDLSPEEGLRFLEDGGQLKVAIDGVITGRAIRRLNITGEATLSVDAAGIATLTVGNETAKNKIYSFEFTEANRASDEFLEANGDGKNSDASPHVIPFNSKVVGYTLTNSENDANTDVEIYRVAEGNGSGPAVLVDTWVLRSVRTARKTNFSSDIVFSAGDKVVAFVRDRGNDPDDVVFKMYLQVTSEVTGENVENWAGDINVPGS
jgi:hypothetical protein